LNQKEGILKYMKAVVPFVMLSAGVTSTIALALALALLR